MSMKNKCFLLVIAVVCMILCGCAENTPTKNMGSLEVMQGISEESGIKINKGEVTLDTPSGNDEIFLTEDILFTNTTKINISVSGLSGDEEIVVYLYDAEYMDHYIAAATLTTTQEKFTFSNLISITGYRVGAKPRNLLASKSLIITD